MREMSAVEQAYRLAQTGDYANFTEIKRALRRKFNVERELVGKALSASVTKLCRANRSHVTASD